MAGRSTSPHNVTPPYFSPLSSTSTTPSANSPTSPRQSIGTYPMHPPQTLPKHPATRQLHPPKSPLFIPAVLRPTERPPRPAPLTPPRSIHSSTDSLASPTTPRNTSPPPPMTIITTLSRTSTRSSLPTSPITAHPTRTHWKPDSQADHCDAAACPIAFSILSRRHHCRRCGGIFCSQHVSRQVPLDEDAHFDQNCGLFKACEACWTQWLLYEGQAEQRREDEMTGGVAAIPVGKKQDSENGASAIASTPGNYNWSTF